jgi:hypothetical protein
MQNTRLWDMKKNVPRQGASALISLEVRREGFPILPEKRNMERPLWSSSLLDRLPESLPMFPQCRGRISDLHSQNKGVEPSQVAQLMGGLVSSEKEYAW